MFQNLSVPDILRLVFIEPSPTDFSFRVMQGTYPKPDYCVQLAEFALDFVSRLMEHLGLFDWHEHGAEKHVRVKADRYAATGRRGPTSVSLAANARAGAIQMCSTISRPRSWQGWKSIATA